MESPEFLRSLEHINPHRPTFSIKRGVYPMLEISHGDQLMDVPMAEILEFAWRWRADHDAQRPARMASGDLDLFPYPLMDTMLTDPDCSRVGWWVIRSNVPGDSGPIVTDDSDGS